MPSNSSDLIRFNKFFSENQQRFIRFAWTYTRDEIVAEDIVMEALMSYWENRLKISSEINPFAYVLTVVKNKCLNHLRHYNWSMKCPIASVLIQNGSCQSYRHFGCL